MSMLEVELGINNPENAEKLEGYDYIEALKRKMEEVQSDTKKVPPANLIIGEEDGKEG